MTTEPGPHRYLSCEENERFTERYQKALNRILKRSCRHCSAWEDAASALGLTYRVSDPPIPSAAERLVKQQREDILKLRDALKTYDVAYGEDVGVLRDWHAETDKALADTEHYEKYRPSREAQERD